MTYSQTRRLLGTVAALALAPTAAWAQEAAEPILENPFGLEVDASIDVSGGYVSNVFATETAIQDDFVTVISPEVGVSKKGDGYSFALGGSAEVGRFLDLSSEDYVDGAVRGEGRVRLAPDVFLFGGADYQWEHEPRSSPDDVAGQEPTRYRDGSAFAGVSGRFDDVTARVGATVHRLNFDDVSVPGGGVVNNKDRDRVQSEYGGRVGYFVAPDTQVFAQGIYDVRNYDNEPDDLGFRRSSDGFQAAVGVAGQRGNVSGEVLVGALVQDYEDPRFDTVATPDIGAELTWQASPRTRVTGTVERAIEETTLDGASGYVRTTGGGRVTQRVAPDLSLTGYAYLTQNDYQQIPRIDYITEIGADLRYYMSPHTFAGLSYGWASRTSDAAGADYDAHTIMLNLGADLNAAYVPGAGTTGVTADGFYVGAFGSDGAVVTSVNGPRAGGGGTLTADFGGFGQSTGLFGGYRAMIGDLALGVEVEGELGGGDWRHLGDRTFSVDRRNSFGAGVLVGHETTNGVLLYGRAGVATTESDSVYQRGGTANRISDRETGPRFAVGAEFPVGNGVSGRLEYAYTSYGDYAAGAPLGVADDRFANNEAMARFGLLYKFGKPEAAETVPVDFSGPYVGVQVGHGTLVSRNIGPRPNAAAPNFVLDVTRAGQGLTGGLFAGYGHTFGDLYLGVEGEVELSNANWNIERDPTGRIYSVEKKELVGGAVRAGYVLNDSVLLYLRGGVVGTDFQNEYRTGGGGVVDQSEFQVGARYGGGVEFALDETFRMRLDYTRSAYPGYTVTYGGGADTFDNDENLFRLGIAYGF